MKKSIKILACAFIVICMVSGCKKKGTPISTATPTQQPGTIIEDSKTEELSILNFSVYYDEKESLSTVSANIKNETNNTITFASIKVSLLDKTGKEIISTIADLGGSLEAGQTKSFTSKITMDVRNTSKITYEFIR